MILRNSLSSFISLHGLVLPSSLNLLTILLSMVTLYAKSMRIILLIGVRALCRQSYLSFCLIAHVTKTSSISRSFWMWTLNIYFYILLICDFILILMAHIILLICIIINKSLNYLMILVYLSLDRRLWLKILLLNKATSDGGILCIKIDVVVILKLHSLLDL